MEDESFQDMREKVELMMKNMKRQNARMRCYKHKGKSVMLLREQAELMRDIERLGRSGRRDDILTKRRGLPDHVSSWRTEHLLELPALVQLLEALYAVVLTTATAARLNHRQMDQCPFRGIENVGSWELLSIPRHRSPARMQAHAFREMTRLVEFFTDIMSEINCRAFDALLDHIPAMNALFYMQKCHVRSSSLASCELLQQLASLCCRYSRANPRSLYSILMHLGLGMQYSCNNVTKAASCLTLANLARDGLDLFILHERMAVLPTLAELLLRTPDRNVLLNPNKMSMEVLLRMALFLALSVVCDVRFNWNKENLLFSDPLLRLISNTMWEMLHSCTAYQEQQEQQQQQQQQHSSNNDCCCSNTLLEVSWLLAKASYTRVHAVCLLTLPNMLPFVLHALRHVICNNMALGVSQALLQLLTNFFYYTPAAAVEVCEQGGLVVLFCVAKGSAMRPLHPELLQLTVNFCRPHQHSDDLKNQACVLQSRFFYGEFLLALAINKVHLHAVNHRP